MPNDFRERVHAIHAAAFRKTHQLRQNVKAAIAQANREGTMPADQVGSPPDSAAAWTTTETAQRAIESAIPRATAPASGKRRRRRARQRMRPRPASAAGTAVTGCADRSHNG